MRALRTTGRPGRRLLLPLCAAWLLMAAYAPSVRAQSGLFWRNATGGENYVWQLDGLAPPAGGYLPAVPDQAWQMAGRGDLDGDGQSDIVWRNVMTGQNHLWLLSGSTLATQGAMPDVGDSHWRIAGIADLDADGHADIVWRNTASGETYAWLMNGVDVVRQAYLPTVVDLNWQIAGVADLDADGHADIVWRNSASGETYAWLMDGLDVVQRGYLPTVADLNWQIAGLADTDGDGRADVVWRNTSTGETCLWLMNGLTVAATGFLPTVADPNWQMVAFGDANGDRKADIVWRHATSGQSYLWLLDGPGMLAGRGFLPTVSDPDWHPLADVAAASQAGGLPVINSFTSGKASLGAGQSTALNWSANRAGSLRIDAGIGKVTGSTVTVSPTATTRYTLTASNAFGSVARILQVNFIPLLQRAANVYQTEYALFYIPDPAQANFPDYNSVLSFANIDNVYVPLLKSLFPDDIFSDQDLYAMGLNPAFPDTYVLTSPVLNSDGSVSYTALNKYDHAWVVAKNGPRVPDYQTSDKQFRLGFIYIARDLA